MSRSLGSRSGVATSSNTCAGAALSWRRIRPVTPARRGVPGVGAVRHTALVDMQTFLPTAVLSIVTGVVGYGASVRTQMRSLRRELREEAAGSIVPALEAVRELVRYAPDHTDAAEWIEKSAAALDALEAELHRLPPAWRHLQQSVRITIGAASGTAAFADRWTSPHPPELMPYCSLWMDHADSYLTYAIRGLREWRDGLRAGRRRVPQLLSFDRWLATTDRAGLRCECGLRTPPAAIDPVSA
jgi:hypothetical protein